MKRMCIVVLACSLAPAAVLADAARFTGVWEGAPVEAGRMRHAALVCRPRGNAGLAGTFYMDGAVFGDLEDGRAHGDSLTFHSGPFLFAGTATGDSLQLTLAVPHGQTHLLALARASADTL